MTFRWWQVLAALLVSVAIHGAVDRWLQETEDTPEFAGSRDVQISILGNAMADMLTEGDEVEFDVAAHETPTSTQPVSAAIVQPTVVQEAVRALPVSVQSPVVTPMSLTTALPESQSQAPIIVVSSMDIPIAEQISSANALSPADVSSVTTAKANNLEHPLSREPEALANRRPQDQQPLQADAKSEVQVVDEIAANRALTADPLEPDKSSERDDKIIKAKSPQAQPVQAIEQQEAKPLETAALIKPIEPVAIPKKKPVQKKKKVRKGKKGSNKKDANKGKADGARSGASDTAGTVKNGKKKGASGNAAVSNYPGKVRRKLRRALRYPKKARPQKLKGTALVRFRVGANGAVTVAAISRSSGSSILDAAALATVRRAAPFPKIPAAAKRKNWEFTVPLTFTPRSR